MILVNHLTSFWPVAAGLAMVQKPPGMPWRRIHGLNMDGSSNHPNFCHIPISWSFLLVRLRVLRNLPWRVIYCWAKRTRAIGSARFALPFRLSLFQVMTLDSWASGFVRQLMDIQVWTGGLLGKKRRIRLPKDDENFDMEKSSSWGLKWKASPFLTYFPLNHHDFW